MATKKKTNGRRRYSQDIEVAMKKVQAKRAAAVEQPPATPAPAHMSPPDAPKLSALLEKIPALIDLRRATFADTSIEQCAAVAQCLGIPLSVERDPRFYGLTPQQLRGHRAEEIQPPPAAIVRTENTRFVHLVTETGFLSSSVAPQMRVTLVGSFYTDVPGQIPREPGKFNIALSPEAEMRVQMLFTPGMSEDEATSRHSPWNPRRWKETSAQSVDIRAALYRQPGSGSTILWIEHPLGLLWPVCCIRKPLYRAPEPEQPRGRNYPYLAIV